MARSDPTYVRIDSELLSSLEWKSASPSARCLYLYLWNYAVKSRMETFPLPKQHILSGSAGIPISRVKSSLDELKIFPSFDKNYPFIAVIKNDLITITGVKAKHAKLKGWSDPYGDDTGGIGGTNPDDKGKQREREGERELKDSVSKETGEAPIDFNNLLKSVKPEKHDMKAFMKLTRERFESVLGTDAVNWAGQQWNRLLVNWRDDEDWNRDRVSKEGKIGLTLLLFKDWKKPFDFAAANEIVKNPTDPELQYFSDHYKREDEKAAGELAKLFKMEDHKDG